MKYRLKLNLFQGVLCNKGCVLFVMRDEIPSKTICFKEFFVIRGVYCLL